MGLFDLLEKETQEQEKTEEIKEAEVVEEQQADDSKKEDIAESKEKISDVKKNNAAKKKSTDKKDDKNAAKKKEEKGYLYPFQIYSEGHYIDIDSFGFVEGQRYSDKEITEVMRNHKIWEFFGNVTYSFMKEDNVLLANFTQHKKG